MNSSMKKILFAAAFAVCAPMAFVACSGSSTDEPTDTKVTAITLSVDKESIEANGEDAVQFKVMGDNGQDLTGVQGVRILIPATETFLDGMQYTSTMNETVVFQARYQGIYSNEVTVTVKNRGLYEKYFRHVMISQMTSTGCINCPNMSSTLKTLSAQYPDRLQLLAFHTDYSGTKDPFTIDAANSLASQFSVQGYPSAIVDMRTMLGGASSGPIVTQINRSLQEYPATCGVKVSSVYDQATKMASASISVAADKANTYSIGAAVVLDGQPATGDAAQSGADASYVHNNIVLLISNINGGFVGDGKMDAGDEVSLDMQFNLSDAKYDGYDRSQMRVVAFALAMDGDNFYVNNTASCALDGGSVDYILNE